MVPKSKKTPHLPQNAVADEWCTRYYFEEFNITDEWMKGLLNGAPYLCSLVIGCWTTAPLNRYFGRRGCIFISCLLAIVAAVWQAVAHTWWNLLLARFVLGLAVGAKSTTTPVYGAECTPAVIRGALVMMWQMWTAFGTFSWRTSFVPVGTRVNITTGIMLGFIASVAFMNVHSDSIPGLNWRLMLGSTGLPYVFLAKSFIVRSVSTD